MKEPAQVRGVQGRLILTGDRPARAWEIALRLKEQGNRLGAHHDISQSLPESALDLQVLEGQIQRAARRLEAATGVTAISLENLIDELDASAPEERISDRGNTDPWVSAHAPIVREAQAKAGEAVNSGGRAIDPARSLQDWLEWLRLSNR